MIFNSFLYMEYSYDWQTTDLFVISISTIKTWKASKTYLSIAWALWLTKQNILPRFSFSSSEYLLIHIHSNTFKLLSMKGWRGGGKYWEEGMEAVYLRDILWCERLSLEFCVSLFPCNLSTHFSPVFQPLSPVPLSTTAELLSLNTSHTESR